MNPMQSPNTGVGGEDHGNRVSEESMKLPEGKTCADCAHTKRCCAMFGVKPTNTECDFYPIRFVKRPSNNG